MICIYVEVKQHFSRLSIYSKMFLVISAILCYIFDHTVKPVLLYSLEMLGIFSTNSTKRYSGSNRYIIYYQVKTQTQLCVDHLPSQGLRFGSPFSPPLADLEYILKFARNATWWFIEVAHLRQSSSPANQNRFVIRMLEC